MKLKNLYLCYLYEPIPQKELGETILKWKYKCEKRMNVQQDIGQLDVNSAGLIDFDKIKIRTDYDIDLNKQDGLSFELLKLDDDGYAIKPPLYRVSSKTKVGTTTTYSCEIYHGE